MLISALAVALQLQTPAPVDDFDPVAARAACAPPALCETAFAEVSFATPTISVPMSRIRIGQFSSGAEYSRIISAQTAHASMRCDVTAAEIRARARRFLVQRFEAANLRIGNIDGSDTLIIAVARPAAGNETRVPAYLVEIDLSGIRSGGSCWSTITARIHHPPTWAGRSDSFCQELVSAFYSIMSG